MTPAGRIELARVRDRIKEAERQLTALGEWADVLQGKANAQHTRDNRLKVEDG